MKRSMQEIIELVVFGLIAVLLATGVLWLVGWLLGLVSTALVWLAGLVWAVLMFIVPVAVVAGIVYLVVRLVQQNQDGRTEAARPAAGPPPPEAERAAAEPPPPGPPPSEPPPSEPPPSEPPRSGAPEGVAPPPPSHAGEGEGGHDAGVPVADDTGGREPTESPARDDEDGHPR